MQVKLSLQRSDTADDGTWKASVVAAAAQTAAGGVVSTSLPQLQMRDWDQWGDNVAFFGRRHGMPKNPRVNQS